MPEQFRRVRGRLRIGTHKASVGRQRIADHDVMGGGLRNIFHKDVIFQLLPGGRASRYTHADGNGRCRRIFSCLRLLKWKRSRNGQALGRRREARYWFATGYRRARHTEEKTLCVHAVPWKREQYKKATKRFEKQFLDQASRGNHSESLWSLHRRNSNQEQRRRVSRLNVHCLS